MGLWSWIKHTVRDVGEHEPVPVHLERAPGGGYQFRLGLRAGFGGQQTARIPVAVRRNEAAHPILKEIHYCEVAGRMLETANVYALRDKVARTLDAITPARTLPLAYFRAPALGFELPVYEDEGEFVSPVVPGTTLKAEDLASIRSEVCRYLHEAGYVAEPEDVEVGVVRPRDLQLVSPAAIFRSLSDEHAWFPSVEGISEEGPVVGIIGHAFKLRTQERRRAGAGVHASDSAPAAPDVLSLLRLLRAELVRDRSPVDPSSIYACEVRPEIWAEAEDRSEDSGHRLVAHLTDDEGSTLELAVRHTGAGDYAVALDDQGITVMADADVDRLARIVGHYLAANDFLRFAEEVEIHAVAAPRAERLDADAIWTHDDAVGVTENDAAGVSEPEEVHT